MRMAIIISRIFDPIVVFSVMTLLAAGWSRYLVVFLIGMLAPPVAFLIFAIKKKWVSNWDVSDRRQRIRVFLVFSLFLLTDYFMINTFGNFALQRLFLFFVVWFIGFFAITLFWKISGHVAAVTLASYYIVAWFGLRWWPVFLTIPPVAWARVVSKNHTIAQVVGGILYSSVLFLWLV